MLHMRWPKPFFDMQVQGYVKNVAAVGMFVTLSSSVEARVKLGHLSNTFVEDPKAAFLVGQLVTGHIVSIQGSRCAVLLHLCPSTPHHSHTNFGKFDGDPCLFHKGQEYFKSPCSCFHIIHHAR